MLRFRLFPYIDDQEFAVTVPNNTDTFVLTVTVGANVQSATVVNGKANMSGLTTGDIGTAKLYNLKDLNTVIASTNFVYKAPVTHVITITAPATGTLTAKVDGAAIVTGASVKEGRDVIFTATPAAGDRVKEWTVGGVAVAGQTGTTFTLANVKAATTVAVVFEAIPDYTMTFAPSDANGTLKASVGGAEVTSPATVQEGKDITFLAIPNAGYKVKEWTVGGTAVAGQTGTTFTIENVKANATVAVVFEALPTKTVTFANPTNGTLVAKVDGVEITSAPDVTGTVLVGEDVVFTVTPVAGYRVKEWKVGTEVQAGQTANTFTLTNLTADVTVSVVLELDI